MFSGAIPETISPHSPPRHSATDIPSAPAVQAGLLETLLTQSRDAALVVEAPSSELTALRIVYANPACLYLGLDGSVRGLTFDQALAVFRDALADSALVGRVRSCLTAGLPLRGEALVGEYQGQPRHALLDLSPLPAPASTPLSAPPLWLITVRDVAPTDSILADPTLLRTLIDTLPDQIHVKDRQGRYLLDNEAHRRGRNLRPGETVGKTVEDFFPPPLARLYEADDRSVLHTGRAIRDREEPTLDQDGRRRWVSTTRTPLIGAGGEVVGLIGVSRDITDQMLATESLTQTKHLLTEAVARADRDPLTGLLNHRAFHKRLEQEAEAARRSGLPLAIAMMDLDNFRFFNDGYGHSIGDDLLRQVSGALSAACRPGDTLARYGGDEFALLLPGLGAEGAVRLADRLVASLSGVGYRPPGYDAAIPLTLSIGIAMFPDDGPGRLDTLAAADARLARVKTGGYGRGDLADRLRAHLPCSQADFSMLNALVTAVDAKDRYTRRHSEDVMAYSFQIAQELGLDEKEQRRTLLAALLHDVGKIGVPDSILRKPGKLTGEEYEAIKQHPMMGSIIVGAMPGFEGTLDAIRHHHERWDGLGYPFGLVGAKIPQVARIMAVADAFSAMTTDRPYRKGMDARRALCILQEGAGSQWDPECIAAFAAVRHKLDDLDGWLGEA